MGKGRGGVKGQGHILGQQWQGQEQESKVRNRVQGKGKGQGQGQGQESKISAILRERVQG